MIYTICASFHVHSIALLQIKIGYTRSFLIPARAYDVQEINIKQWDVRTNGE